MLTHAIMGLQVATISASYRGQVQSSAVCKSKQSQLLRSPTQQVSADGKLCKVQMSIPPVNLPLSHPKLEGFSLRANLTREGVGTF